MGPHEPCSEEHMGLVWPEFTICQLMRNIYHLTDDEEIRLLCRIGQTMAKKMDAKLRQYKADWAEGFWPEPYQAKGEKHERQEEDTGESAGSNPVGG
jgi:hypothetical protein